MSSRSSDTDSLTLQRSGDATEAGDQADLDCPFADENGSLNGSKRERQKAPTVKGQGQRRAANAGVEPAPSGRVAANAGGFFDRPLGGIPGEIRLCRAARADRLPPRKRRVTLDSDASTEHGCLREDPNPRTELMGYVQRRNPIEQSDLRYRYVKLAMSMARTDLSRRQLVYQNVHALVLANPARWRLRRRVLADLLSGGECRIG